MFKASRKLIFFIPVFFLTTNAFADSLFPSFLMSPCTRVVLQAGWFWAHQGTAQDIGIEGLIGDRFTVEHHYDNDVLLGLGYYINAINNDSFKIMYGINAFYLAPSFVKGHVIQEGIFENLSYQYKVINWPLYADVKAFINVYPPYPYELTLDLGLGGNFISAGHFREFSIDGGVTIPDDPFSSHLTGVFSASAGIGVQVDGVFECGYRFFYLGQGQFNTKTNQVLNTLKTGQSYAHAVLCSISA